MLEGLGCRKTLFGARARPRAHMCAEKTRRASASLPQPKPLPPSEGVSSAVPAISASALARAFGDVQAPSQKLAARVPA